jgi:hypothetical protein
MPHLIEMATMPLCELRHDNNDRRRRDPHHYLASDLHSQQRLDDHLLHRHVRQMPTLTRNRAY